MLSAKTIKCLGIYPMTLSILNRSPWVNPSSWGVRRLNRLANRLPGRTSIIISRRSDYAVEGCVVVNSLESAIEAATKVAQETNVDELMVIGGAQIYAEAIKHADRLYLTEVKAEVDGDARFEWDASGWKEVKRTKNFAEEKNPYDYDFVVYEK